MNEENMSKENITDNKPAAEPRFKVGDVVWTATTMLENDNPVFVKCKILALCYIRANGKSVFSGYRLLDDNCRSHKPETVFATKEECEDFVDRVVAPRAKELWESSSKMEGLEKFLKKCGEYIDKDSNEEEA